MKNLETLLKDYIKHAADRASKGIPPLALNAAETNTVTELLESANPSDSEYLINLLKERVPPGVDEAAYVKASWLTAIANGEKTSTCIDPKEAIKILGTMIGGYNVNALVEIIKKEDYILSQIAADMLKKIILV